jgi:hypothetical protein
MAIADSTVTMTAACEIFGRHAGTGRAACSGTIVSLTSAHLTDCTCRCHLDDEPEPEEEDTGLDAYVELAVERELERAHGWWS